MKKGFTIVELLVALAITGVVGVFLAGFLTPQIQNFKLITEQGLAQSQCAGVLNVIQGQIEFATDITIKENGEIDYTPVVENGAAVDAKRTLHPITLANEQFPNVDRDGKKFAVTVENKGNGIFELVVKVLNKDDDADDTNDTVVYQLTQSVRCLNQMMQESQ